MFHKKLRYDKLIFSILVITTIVNFCFSIERQSSNTNEAKGIEIRLDLELKPLPEDENYFFKKIEKVDVDSRENIYILDSGLQIVKKFDKNGKYLGLVSQRGQGPGELMLPFGLRVSKKDQIYIYDWGTRKLHIFSMEGNHLYSIPFHESLLIDFDIDSADNLLCLESVIENKKTYLVLRKYNKEKTLIKEILRIEQPEHIKIPLNKGVMRVHTKFHPMLRFALSSNDKIYVGFSKEYKINVLNPEGKLIKIIEREFRPIKIPEKDKKEELERQLEGTGISVEALNLNKINFPKEFPAYEIILVDSKDRVWVKTFKIDKEQNYFIDIFDVSQKKPFILKLKGYPRVIKKDFLYVTEEDKKGFQIIKRYKIIEKSQ